MNSSVTTNTETEAQRIERLWRQEEAKKATPLNWFGCGDRTGKELVEFFETKKISCNCIIPCTSCGFHYLNDQGEALNPADTPMCGEW